MKTSNVNIIGYAACMHDETQVKHMVEMVRERLGDLEKKKVAILGLSFSPSTDDMRAARSS